MRGLRIAFVGLLAAIAGCTTYGESASEKEAPPPGGIDGGGGSSSGSPTRDGGTNVPPGVGLEDGGFVNEPAEGGVIVGSTSTPKIIQAGGSGIASSAAKLTVKLPKGIASGNTVVVFAGGAGAKVTSVVAVSGLGALTLDAVGTSGPFAAMSGWVTTAPSNLAGTFEIAFENMVANPTAIAIEIENAGSRAANSQSGKGSIVLSVDGLSKNDLLLGCALGSGVTPGEPIGGKAVTAPVSTSGQTMVAAATTIAADLRPSITWTANGSLQWDGMTIAFRPLR